MRNLMTPSALGTFDEGSLHSDVPTNADPFPMEPASTGTELHVRELLRDC